MKMTEQSVLKAIEDMVQEKTLSLEALRGLGKIKDEAVRLSAELEATKAKYNDLEKSNTTTLSSLDAANKKVLEWEKRAAELAAREKAADVAKFAAQKDYAVAEAYKDMLKTIFAPNYFREHVTKQVPVPHTTGGSGYTNTDVRQHQQDENRTVIEGA